MSPYYNVQGTYHKDKKKLEANHRFHQWDIEREPLDILLHSFHPDIIISALRGDFSAQISAHLEAIRYIMHHKSKLIFLSSANVFDAFTNFPSYEYDKTFSVSVYGRFKIQIENALLRLPNEKYNIIRMPMVFGRQSPRVRELETLFKIDKAIEVFPNVVINATTISKVTQQIHFIINQELIGVFHLGSTDLTHHEDLILEICRELSIEHPKITQVYESNDDRFLAILPRDNPLPHHLNITTDEVIKDSGLP